MVSKNKYKYPKKTFLKIEKDSGEKSLYQVESLAVTVYTSDVQNVWLTFGKNKLIRFVVRDLVHRAKKRAIVA